jgi:DNA repair exonuclease SbcCD ATPase subunit
MKVLKVTRKNYMTPGTHTLSLPEQGLVLITGTNGSGKSSWIDAVGTVWNKQVRNPKDRKSHGNLPDASAKVEVESYEGLKVKRNWTAAGKSSLAWEVQGDHVDSSTTKSKGQAALEAEVGDYKPWRWSCLISSQSTDTFSRATSANRRVILEDVLDLDILARAHKKVHEESSALKKELMVLAACLSQKQQEKELAEQSLAAAQASFDALVEPVLPPKPQEPAVPPSPKEPTTAPLILPERLAPAPAPPPPDLPEVSDVAPLTERLVRLEKEHADAEKKLTELRSSYAKVDAEVQQAQRLLADAKASLNVSEEKCGHLANGQCPTCSQSVSKSSLSDFEGERLRLAEDASRASQELLDAQAARDQNVSEGKETRALIDDLAKRKLEAKSAVDEHARQVDERRESSKKYEQALEEHQKRLDAADSDYARLCEEATSAHAAQVEAARVRWEEELASYDDHVSSVRSQYAKTVCEWEEHCATVTEQHKSAKDAAHTALSQATEALQEVNEALDAMLLDVDTTNADLLLRSTALDILGPSGVRAEILDNAMRGVTQEANAVLSSLETDVRVRLFAEGKDVGLETVGGRGPRYEDLSNGEQHRVDFSLLRGLGRVAAALRGQKDDGTLFIDEALDGIDDNGLDAVCEYLQSISKDRCVVVITHRAEVISRLRAVKRVEMVDSRKHQLDTD